MLISLSAMLISCTSWIEAESNTTRTSQTIRHGHPNIYVNIIRHRRAMQICHHTIQHHASFVRIQWIGTTMTQVHRRPTKAPRMIHEPMQAWSRAQQLTMRVRCLFPLCDKVLGIRSSESIVATLMRIFPRGGQNRRLNVTIQYPFIISDSIGEHTIKHVRKQKNTKCVL